MRTPNPLLKKLGYSNDDRVVIIHVDDVGMCQSSIDAFADLWQRGTISSGAVMMPCSWALHVARLCRETPGVDMGVHITLTSEWPTYRWGPISTRDPKTGLIDEQGYFYRTSRLAQDNAHPDAAQVEMEAQVRRAMAAGIDPTHMDTHMGTVAHPRLLLHYLQLAMALGLPPMMLRLHQVDLQEDGQNAAELERHGLTPETAAILARMLASFEEQGMPLLDQIATVHLDEPEQRLERIQQVLSGLPTGLTHFIIHPAKDTPELRAITPDWRCRVGDYEAFLSDEMERFLKNSGLQVIGYRDIKDTIPAF